MKCLICEDEFNEASWSFIITFKTPALICEKCKGKFERNDVHDNLSELENVQSLYKYNDFMKDVFHQYKFGKDVELAKIFRDDLQFLGNEKRIIVPVPLHEKKLKERTFSQVEELLNAANINFSRRLVKRKNVTIGTLTKEERFQLNDLFNSVGNVDGENILLIDDLFTTGTTLQQAARALKKAGAITVTAWTLIRA